MQTISQTEINDYLARNRGAIIRQACRSSLITFGQYVDPVVREKYPPGTRHAEKLSEALEAIYRGDIKRLLVSIPPRHGKSYFTSRLFIPWILGHNPRRNIILASYGADLSEDFSRYQMNLLNSPEYKDIFDTRLSDTASSAKRYQTTAGGLVVACGVGGPIYGRGADIGIIDDPIKDWEQANSQTQLEKINEWYSGFRTRLHKGGAIVLCMHRWKENDLAGFLLDNDKESGEWEYLAFPAIAEDEKDPIGRQPGQALWPTEYDEKELARIKSEILPKVWMAQYQQRPDEKINTIFPDPIYFDELPVGEDGKPLPYKLIAYLDPAYGDDKNNDSSALTIGCKIGNVVYIVAGYLWKSRIDVTYDKVEAFFKQYNVSSLTYEINKDEGAVGIELRRRGLWVNEERTSKNKFLKITDALLKNWQNIRFSRNVREDYMREVLRYDELAKHDDAPDSLAGLIKILIPAKPVGVISKRER